MNTLSLQEIKKVAGGLCSCTCYDLNLDRALLRNRKLLGIVKNFNECEDDCQRLNATGYEIHEWHMFGCKPVDEEDGTAVRNMIEAITEEKKSTL